MIGGFFQFSTTKYVYRGGIRSETVTNEHFTISFKPFSVLYTIIFRRLRQRERARSLRQAAKTETDRISNALLGGARFARQMGTHFKHKTDQILLEISFQVNIFTSFQVYIFYYLPGIHFLLRSRCCMFAPGCRDVLNTLLCSLLVW